MTVAPEVSLQGSLTRIRPRTVHDMPLFVRWYTDPEVAYWLHMSEVSEVTLEGETARYESQAKDPTRLGWTIESLDGVPIGYATLVAINDLHKRAELGITIGETAYWDRGYGADSVRLVLRFAFENLDMRRVELITDWDNERGIRCYEKCGFVREGVLREARLRQGRPIDMLLMSVLCDEWLRD